MVAVALPCRMVAVCHEGLHARAGAVVVITRVVEATRNLRYDDLDHRSAPWLAVLSADSRCAAELLEAPMIVWETPQVFRVVGDADYNDAD